MGSREAADFYFGTRVRAERERRGWTQEELAKRLSHKGIPVYASTIAKIESEKKPRPARLGEAAGIADLFEVSVDSLLGRKPGAQRSELKYLLRTFRDTAQMACEQVERIMIVIRDQLEELPGEFDGADMLQKRGYDTLENRLWPAYDALMGVVNLSQELLRREQGTAGALEEALMVLGVPQDDEAQS